MRRRRRRRTLISKVFKLFTESRLFFEIETKRKLHKNFFPNNFTFIFLTKEPRSDPEPYRIPFESEKTTPSVTDASVDTDGDVTDGDDEDDADDATMATEATLLTLGLRCNR